MKASTTSIALPAYPKFTINAEGELFDTKKGVQVVTYKNWFNNVLKTEGITKTDNLNLTVLHSLLATVYLSNPTPRNKTDGSGYMGVSLYKRMAKYVAEISHKGKRYRIGCYNTALEAAQAYDKEAIRLGKKKHNNLF
jgi:hypothetical protein